MKYKIAVCDDDQAQSEYIKNIVMFWALEANAAVSVSVFHSANAVLFDDCNDYDIFLLDIEMPEISGIKLAKMIRENNETAVIIFITGHADYIAEGYDVSALHYLMKPIDKQKLFSVLDKALKFLGRSEKYLALEMCGETHRVPLREIRYIEVTGNYVTIHAKDDFTIKKTLAELETQLDERFARTGRSFIVNLGFIRRITKTDVCLSSGETIPLSRGMYESLNRAIIDKV